MKILLSPKRRDDTLEVVRDGDTLIVNGQAFNFAPMSDGDTLPCEAIASEWFVSDVDKKNGELALTLMLPLPANYSQEQAFPEPLLNVPNGPVALPQPTPIPEPDVQEVDA